MSVAQQESPNTVYGRLLESVHISGYSAARACDELEWLVQEHRWKTVGPGFENGAEFLAAINLSEFKYAVDRRKKLVKILYEIDGSTTQRAVAKVLGVDVGTVNKDLNVEKSTKATNGKKQNHGLNGKLVEHSTATTISQSGIEAAEQLRQQIEQKQNKELRARELADQRAIIAAGAESVPVSDRWAVHHADMRTWSTARGFDWIITDPPYPKEYLPLYETLALRAKEWLKEGGLVVAMCGQSYLDQITEMMSRHLTYYWTAAYLTPGQPTPLRQVNVNTTWKPLLIFSKGKYVGKIFGDVFRSDGNDKDFHDWGQSISGMKDIVSRLALPGERILDPFCGAGTTGVAAVLHGCLFDGVDADAERCRISMTRLGDATKSISIPQ